MCHIDESNEEDTTKYHCMVSSRKETKNNVNKIDLKVKNSNNSKDSEVKLTEQK